MLYATQFIFPHHWTGGDAEKPCGFTSKWVDHGFKLRTATAIAAAILRLRWCPQRHHTAIAVCLQISQKPAMKRRNRPQQAVDGSITVAVSLSREIGDSGSKILCDSILFCATKIKLLLHATLSHRFCCFSVMLQCLCFALLCFFFSSVLPKCCD